MKLYFDKVMRRMKEEPMHDFNNTYYMGYTHALYGADLLSEDEVAELRGCRKQLYKEYQQSLTQS